MQPANQDSQDAKKGGAKDADGKGLSKLKDPNQAHETLDIAKNVP